jgi:hypothetical protein
VVICTDTDFSDEEFFLFLLRIYQWDAEQHGEGAVCLWDLAKDMQYARADAQRLADTLQKKGLLSFVSLSGDVSLTSLGSFEVMLALSQPRKSTRFFPAIAAFNNLGMSVASLTHGNLTGFVSHLKDFNHELSLSSELSDRLGVLVDQLELAIENGRSSVGQVVNELQAIDQLLATGFRA